MAGGAEAAAGAEEGKMDVAASGLLAGTATKISRTRTVSKIFENREQGEGMGARVRRSLGTPELRYLDPFLMLDMFHVSKPAGFPDHPHRGFETVTYMLEGRFMHEDFAGHKGEIGPGDLQWMTAGRGIVHCEMPLSDEPSRGLQLWVNLKAKDKMVEPAYQELLDKDIPKVSCDGITSHVIAGESLGVSSPVRTRTPTMYLDLSLEPGATLEQPIPAGWNAFAFVLEGAPVIGDEAKSTVAPQYHTVLLTNNDKAKDGEAADGVRIAAGKTKARLVLIAGEPTGEPVAQHGPFVMNTREEIIEAMMDFQSGSNGFERAPGWRSEAAKKMGL